LFNSFVKKKSKSEFVEKIRALRKIGRDRIMERLQAMQNNDTLPDDILTNILKAYSNFLFSTVVPCF
jgi:hypothetical protein